MSTVDKYRARCATWAIRKLSGNPHKNVMFVTKPSRNKGCLIEPKDVTPAQAPPAIAGPTSFRHSASREYLRDRVRLIHRRLTTRMRDSGVASWHLLEDSGQPIQTAGMPASRTLSRRSPTPESLARPLLRSGRRSARLRSRQVTPGFRVSTRKEMSQDRTYPVRP
jgi:hypothetical protein